MGFKGMATLFIPANLPLFVANGADHPWLCAAASGLAFYLAKITINGNRTTPASSFDAVTERLAAASLVTTSTENRVVRIAMGSLHLLGAVLYTMRTTRESAKSE